MHSTAYESICAVEYTLYVVPNGAWYESICAVEYTLYVVPNGAWNFFI